ncbi:excalibur calcium-binding domain-containing protein [Streptomyces triticirhizae]|uniref:excalibur calcium-binding domain-containing protein n=1 Tax=Streptomyces triticirhizae TaxID=2483353 RepID=UPI0018F41CC9|nr:excalibur calcium-binding domain-containing protein [Streptomyces triticirhizae]
MGLSALWLALFVFTNPSDESGEEERADDAEVAAADAEEEPREVPDFAGQNLAVAIEAAEAAGFATASHDATEGDAEQFALGNWSVCFQTPEAGASLALGGTIDFAVVREGDPCPAADGLAVLAPTVPSVVTLSHAEAVERLAEVGLTEVEARGAYRDVELPDEHDDWLVCFQLPAAGEEIVNADTMSARLSLVEPGTDCPGSDNARLDPEPEPEPEPDPEPDLDPDPEPGATTGGSGGDSGGDSGGSVSYRNCSEVRAAGAAPIYAGQPGYGRHLDRDGDGVGCES